MRKFYNHPESARHRTVSAFNFKAIRYLSLLSLVFAGISTAAASPLAEKPILMLFKAQAIVQGTVTDEKGEPLPGVTIIIQDTPLGGVTDTDGKFSIRAKEGDVLVFSFVGYETQTITVGKIGIINVSMTEDATALDEVVVIGYGTQERVTLTGSVASVKADDIDFIPTCRITTEAGRETRWRRKAARGYRRRRSSSR